MKDAESAYLSSFALNLYIFETVIIDDGSDWSIS